MNVALITLTYNDEYKFKEWVDLYNLYHNEVYLHIIIDNGSSSSYIEKLYSNFPKSKIILLGKNLGCTGAYNAGIEYALSYPEVDAIALIGNDVKLLPGSLTMLYDFLYSSTEYKMVYPIVLDKGVDKKNIDNYGYNINSNTIDMQKISSNLSYEELPDFQLCDCGPGGCNISKPEFYTKVGLQDSRLFMYYDEVDMGLRAKALDLKMAVTKRIIAYHEHINPPGDSSRSPHAYYLLARNRIYLAGKHFGLWKKLKVSFMCFKWNILDYFKHFFSSKGLNLPHIKAYSCGIFSGLFNNMENNF